MYGQLTTIIITTISLYSNETDFYIIELWLFDY